jgi:hypothetical protein
MRTFTYFITSFFVMVTLLAAKGAVGQTTIENVPYWYQYYNDNNPGGTCQVTAMASVLEAYGATGVTPDKIYSRHNYTDAKEPYGWAAMFNEEAELYGLSVRASGTKNGSPSSMRSNLDNYKPVVVFGYFTSGGHIMTTLGYNSYDYICHDPAGEWNEVYKGANYSGNNPTGGKYVKYSRDNYEYAIGTPAPEFWMVTFTEPVGEPDPYCTSKGENTAGEWIDAIQLGGYNIESGNNDGYHRNLDFNVNVTQGGSYDLTLQPAFSSQSYTEHWKIFADLNQDEDFNDSGELLFQGKGSSDVTGSLTIPNSAKTGSTRIRFVMKGDSYTSGACEVFSYGEVEDYQLYVEEGSDSDESITVNHPATAAKGSPVTFTGDVSLGIDSVKIFADTWEIGDAKVTNGSYSITYSFNSAGDGRSITAKGYSESGAELASATSTISIAEQATSSVTLDHPSETQIGVTTTFSGTTSDDVALVKIYVDTYYIGEANVANGNYAVDYAFDSAGNDREVVAKGYNSSGTLLATSTSSIDVAESSDYELTLNHPDEVTVGESVSFSGTAAGGIENVVVSVDGYEINNAEVENGSYSFNYTFSSSGTDRNVNANAFVNGESVKQTSDYITVTDNESNIDWGEQFADDLLANSVAYENQAWDDINNQGTPCVAFVSVGLRNHPTDNFPGVYCTVTEGPASESCDIQLDCTLEQLGFSGPHWDLSNLQRGDIVFTDRVVEFQGEYWSSHAMVFDHWANPGSTSYAYFIDYHNERGLPYKRNCTVSGTYDKALFYYRYDNRNKNSKMATATEKLSTSNVEIYPNPAADYVKVKATNAKDIQLSIIDVSNKELFNKTVEGKARIDISHLQAGVYFVRIAEENNIYCRKLIVK